MHILSGTDDMTQRHSICSPLLHVVYVGWELTVLGEFSLQEKSNRMEQKRRFCFIIVYVISDLACFCYLINCWNYLWIFSCLNHNSKSVFMTQHYLLQNFHTSSRFLLPGRSTITKILEMAVLKCPGLTPTKIFRNQKMEHIEDNVSIVKLVLTYIRQTFKLILENLSESAHKN